MTDPLQAQPELADEEQAAAWCLALQHGGLDDAGRGELAAWLAADPRRGEMLARMKALWNAAGEQAQLPEMVRLRENALAAYRHAHGGRGSGRGSGLGLALSRRRAVASMATLVAGLGAAGSAWWLLGETAYATGIGNRQAVLLPDSSRLSLDADSRVVVRYSAHRRELVLERGRAIFDVAKDPLRPFAVAAGTHTVIATGTSFSVEKLAGQVQVILYEGHVRIVDAGGADVLVRPRGAQALAPARAARAALAPNMQIVIDQGSSLGQIMPSPESTPRAWENGRLEFDDEPLGIAAERINRYADTRRIMVAPDAGAIRISGAFNAGDTGVFAQEVANTFHLRLRDDGQVLTLSDK